MSDHGRVRVVGALVCAALLAGCVSQATRELAQSGAPPPKPFRSDGCSLVPDLDIGDCCERHDHAYWQGGSCAQRRQADAVLAQCIREHGRPRIATLYHAGVRIAGAAWLPTPWRWGFGWPYGLGCFDRAGQASPTSRR